MQQHHILPSLRGACLALFSCLVAVPGASAQTAADSIRPSVIYNEPLRAGTPTFVVLREGMAYRIEIIPEHPFDAISSPTVSVRSHQRPELPIRVFSDGETSSRGGQSFIIVPSASAEYRVDVYGTRETATIRIEQAGDELQRLFDFAARPGRSVLTFGFLTHGSGASLTMFGTAPQFRLVSRGRNSVALATNVAFGKADQPFRNARYLVAGVGLSVSRTVGPLSRWYRG